ncbi:Transducin/WD40 repeat-like superfamily protein [Euphorbia peplus]|nr:Transducin/WD40 repeat-like superfamily protein [Euphorbia peplus]
MDYSKPNNNSSSSSSSLNYKCITTLIRPKHLQITCLAIHKSFLYAASSNQITIFDLTTYSLINTFTSTNPTSGSIKSIAFHNSKIFTAHQDCKIRVWKISSLFHPSTQPQLLSTLPTIKDRLRHFMLPRNYVTVRRHKKHLWVQHCDAVSGLALHGGLMYSVSWDKCFKLWNMETNRCLESVRAHHDAVNTLVVSRNGTVFTGSADGSVKVWEKLGKEKRHRMVDTLKMHKSTVNALAWNGDGDGDVLFSGSSDRSIVVWERNDDDRMVFVEVLWGHAGAVLCLMNVQHLLVSGSCDRTVRIWQRGGRREIGYCCMVVMEGHEKPVKSLVSVTRSSGCNGNNGKVDCLSICSGSLDGEIKVWEINANQN